MEDDQNRIIQKMEDDLFFFENRRRPCYFDTRRRPHFFEDGRRPHFYLNGRLPTKMQF